MFAFNENEPEDRLTPLTRGPLVEVRGKETSDVMSPSGGNQPVEGDGPPCNPVSPFPNQTLQQL
jgi:hypothetical protein